MSLSRQDHDVRAVFMSGARPIVARVGRTAGRPRMFASSEVLLLRRTTAMAMRPVSAACMSTDCIGIASALTALRGSLAMGGDDCVESRARVVARVADDRRLFGRRL